VSIIDYRPDLGADYLAVADELLRRLGIRKGRRALAQLLADVTPAASTSAAD
jgi:chromosome partitioning protein